MESAVERASDSNVEDDEIVSNCEDETGELANVRITKAEVAEDAAPLAQAAGVVSGRGNREVLVKELTGKGTGVIDK